jgi:hypothetical protein
MNRKTEDIAAWLSELALRCVPRKAVNLAVTIAAFAQDLSDLPHQAFSLEAREVAARKWKYFPTYSELRKFLSEWTEKHQPRSSLPSVEDDGLSPEDRAHVRSWLNLRGEGNLKVRLSVMRAFPNAFSYIIRTDKEAAAIARQCGWIDDAPIDVSETGIAANLVKLEALSREGPVVVALASLGLSILRKNVGRRAPERLNQLPDGFNPHIAAQQFTTTNQPKPIRSRADDTALLNALRENPALPNRDARMRELEERLSQPRTAAPVTADPPEWDVVPEWLQGEEK